MSLTKESIAVLNTELDKAAVEGLTSGWMDLNDKLVKYNGGDEVKIPVMTMDGLADYDRNDGFVNGAVDLRFETRKLTQDRGRKFNLDENEVDETNFIVTAGKVMGEFQRTKVIPEIDAYRYSTIASIAQEHGRIRRATITATNIFEELYKDIALVEDAFGEGDLIITINRNIANLLMLNKDMSKRLSVGDFKQGDVELKVQVLDNQYPIKKVPSARMFTKYEFRTGKTGQEAGGFAKTSDAKEINWIICHRNAPIAVNKTDKIRVFDPETNQDARAWSTDYRKFHDLWVLENKYGAIAVNVK